MLTRIIPSSGESLPVIGLGTYAAFDPPSKIAYPELATVLDEYSKQGAKLIDSSPMYGKAEAVLGELFKQRKDKEQFFYATKVWTNGRKEGIAQMESSMQKMGRKKLDLIQIHNLLDWKTHLPLLQDWKAEGKVKYIGITHYTDAMHAELEHLIRSERIDFVQFNYSIAARHAEKSLLATAFDFGVATLLNRPLGEGALMRFVKDKKLPPFALESGIKNWSTYFLSYLIAHPAVTCVIPATSNPEHASENLSTGAIELPDEKKRKKMLDYFLSL